ncbi:hypothetical protein BsWGS_10163 [Bradybaena similaris]
MKRDMLFRDAFFWVTLATTVLVILSRSTLVHASYSFIRCGECDEARCPELHYCEGQAIKDHCGCCTVCSSSKFQPHVMIAQEPGGNACDQVRCPKLKVCVVNMQGLPLCTCPSMYVCRGVKTRQVCGTDGQTYESRCHMRIASCNEGASVRKKHRGPCGEKHEDSSTGRKRVKKFKKRRRRRKDENEADVKARQERRRRREKNRKRRKSGKNRTRRHRGKNQVGKKKFDEAFSHYTWDA